MSEGKFGPVALVSHHPQGRKADPSQLSELPSSTPYLHLSRPVHTYRHLRLVFIHASILLAASPHSQATSMQGKSKRRTRLTCLLFSQFFTASSIASTVSRSVHIARQRRAWQDDLAGLPQCHDPPDRSTTLAHNDDQKWRGAIPVK